jgi:hypothetical protein
MTAPPLIVRDVSSTEVRSISTKRATWRRGGVAHVPILEQVRLLARVRIASPRQFGVAFEHDVWWAYKRIQRLCQQGLADRARPLRDLPGVVWATPAGLAALGLARSKPPRLSLDRLGHDLAVTELLLSLRRATGASVLTERELRREQGSRGGAPVPIAASRGILPSVHWPDLAVEAEGRRWAVEIEFSAKGRERLRRTLAAYRRSSYSGVAYYVRDPALARAISSAAFDSGLNGELSLRAWELWPTPSGDVAEIERIARRHRERAATSGVSACNDGARRAESGPDTRREKERIVAIEAWERELERRDSEQVGRRLRLARRPKGS